MTVKADPRVKTPAAVMEQVYSLSKAAYFGALDVQARAGALHELHRAPEEGPRPRGDDDRGRPGSALHPDDVGFSHLRRHVVAPLALQSEDEKSCDAGENSGDPKGNPQQ